MKTLAFVVALVVAAIGAVALVAPPSLIGIAHYFLNSTMFGVAGVVRIGLGLLLVRVAPNSRAPAALRVLGYVIVIAGVATVLAGLFAMERVRAIIEGALDRGPGLVHVVGGVVLALGGFLAYACAPARRG